MFPLPRQGWLFLIEFLKWYSRNTGKCELGRFSVRQSHIEVRVCSYNLSSNFKIYLWNRILLFQQPLHNHQARLSQLCKDVNTLHKLIQPCDNLTKLQQGCYNLVVSVWVSNSEFSQTMVHVTAT